MICVLNWYPFNDMSLIRGDDAPHLLNQSGRLPPLFFVENNVIVNHECANLPVSSAEKVLKRGTSRKRKNILS